MDNSIAANGTTAESLELWASKLQGDWAGPTIGSQLNQQRLAGLPDVFRRGKLDNMVKVRLLLACLFIKPEQLKELKSELKELSAAACEDEDEWVRVTGTAVGDFSGQLHTAHMVQGPNNNQLVDSTLTALWEGLRNAVPPPSFRPLQEVYMHPDVIPRNTRPSSPTPHTHFSVRQEALAVTTGGGNSGGSGRVPLALPPLAALLDGSAALGSSAAGPDGLKGDRGRRDARNLTGATSSMFRPSATGGVGAGSLKTTHSTGVAGLPATANTNQMQPQPCLDNHGSAVETSGGHQASKQGSLPTLGVRPVRMKSLQLTESIQLSAFQKGRGHPLVSPHATNPAGAPPLRMTSSEVLEENNTAEDEQGQPGTMQPHQQDEGAQQEDDQAGEAQDTDMHDGGDAPTASRKRHHSSLDDDTEGQGNGAVDDRVQEMI